ncbi:MAG: Glu-tRNA(Gln) amidotransferase subunit GatE, partial [archaeon]
MDGSNTSGFQRTTQLAFGGSLTIENGKTIRMQGLAIEEDSARPVEKKEGEVVYRLDRLGFPLIELSTEPDIHSPEEAKMTALKMGELMRITGRVKRGLGTIRQDINISVPHGARVELKGVQELDLIDEYVRREMHRQNTLLQLKKTLVGEGLTKEMIESQGGVDVTPLFQKSTAKMILAARNEGHVIHALRLPHFNKKMGMEVQPGRRVGSELSSYVKAKAGLRGLLHGDELPGYGITEDDVKRIREMVHAGEKDSFALVIGPEKTVEFAIGVIRDRAAYVLEGIPGETRNAIEGGNSEYSRPLAGAARMYPETDAHTIEITPQTLHEIDTHLPRWAEERKRDFIHKGLSEKLAEEMKLDNDARFFTRLLEKGYDPTTSATLLLAQLNTIRRENPNVDRLTHVQLEALLEKEKQKIVLRENFPTILRAWAQQPDARIETILENTKVESVENEEVARIIKQIVDKNEHLVLVKGVQSTNALMGMAMQALRGKAQGYFIAQALEKEV